MMSFSGLVSKNGVHDWRRCSISKWDVMRYAWWDASSIKWRSPQTGPPQAILTVKDAQFSLIHGRTVVESFSLVQNPNTARIHVKGASMAVIAVHGDKFRKFKMLFKTAQHAEEATSCLGNYVKIQGYPLGSTAQIPNQDTLPQVLHQLMSSPHQIIPAPQSIPENYPLESAVRLCIIDPGFPSLVEEVEAIVNNLK